MAVTHARESLGMLVKKGDFSEVRLEREPLPAELGEGEVLFRVDRFALTSNNISYALTGDALKYWSFFPAPEGWGRIPAMGYADVVRSAHPDVPEGDRVFGFFPMATHLVIRADQVSPSGYVDAAPHRQETAPAYRQYTRTGGDGLYEPHREDALMLLRGLFMTAFLVDDFIEDQGGFGARATVISSASSKTALALAFLLSQRGERAIGLTSERNVPFVKGLGSYDRVVTYDEIGTLPADLPVVFVDHAGSAAVVDTVHRHFGESLKYSCMVGATHWDATPRGEKLPGPRPIFFFAPAQIQKRAADWGAAGLQERIGDAWRRFVASTDAWLHVVRGSGPAEVERVYREVLGGSAKPEEGHVLSLWEEGR